MGRTEFVRSSVVRAAGVVTDRLRKTIQRDLSKFHELGGLGLGFGLSLGFGLGLELVQGLGLGVGLVRG